jgi:hypothetical protein
MQLNDYLTRSISILQVQTLAMGLTVVKFAYSFAFVWLPAVFFFCCTLLMYLVTRHPAPKALMNFFGASLCFTDVLSSNLAVLSDFLCGTLYSAFLAFIHMVIGMGVERV